MKKIILFDKKENCCGCGSCVNICPQNAVTMKEDEYGFLYPDIDYNICVSCGLCKRACEFQFGKIKNEPLDVYVAAKKDSKSIMQSASGGVFSALAEKVIENRGVVFGAALNINNNYISARHICACNKEDLQKLKSSKYVQSRTNSCYKKAKKALEEGKTVLFSGTPCQIGGLYGYLGKDFDNLFTVDLICHGVPNVKFFNDYISIERKKYNLPVTKINFRDKIKSLGKGIRIDFLDKDNKTKTVYIPARASSYYTFFLDGQINRKSCYSCKYADKYRVGDITLGDFQGFAFQHPELIKKYDEAKGVSCVFINTEKGARLFNSVNEFLNTDMSDYSKASLYNGQLKSPVKKGSNSDYILNLYRDKGYNELEKYFKKKYIKSIILHKLFNKIPSHLRLGIKNSLKKLKRRL